MPKFECQTCKQPLSDEVAYYTCYKDKEITHYICDICARRERVDRYKASGHIDTRFLLDATLALSRFEDGVKLKDYRPELRQLYEQEGDTLIQAGFCVRRINVVVRELEQKLWFPWMQKYFRDSEARGHSADGPGFHALLWGAAGRVLLTLRKRTPDGSGEELFEPSITIIFDETSSEARCGIQGLDATETEAVGLLRAAMEHLKEFYPDEAVSVI